MLSDSSLGRKVMLPMGAELPLCSAPNGGHCQGVWLRFLEHFPAGIWLRFWEKRPWARSQQIFQRAEPARSTCSSPAWASRLPAEPGTGLGIFKQAWPGRQCRSAAFPCSLLLQLHSVGARQTSPSPLQIAPNARLFWSRDVIYYTHKPR